MNIARIQTYFSSQLDRFLLSKSAVFWTLQIAGWGGLFIISNLTLTLFYNTVELPYIAHNLVRSLLGILMTLPMRWVYSYIWKFPLFKRLAIGISIALISSILWTLVIIESFEAMTNTEIALADYGGWIYSSIFIFMSWAASYHGFKYYILLQEEHQTLLRSQADQQHQLLKRSQAENQARLAKLKFLSYQLNPHFLFNALNSVYSMIESKKNTEAQAMIAKLSRFLRVSLSLQEDIFVPVKRELEIANMYLEIEKIRFADRLNIEIDCCAKSESAMMPIFLIQPLIENSIKHALSKSVSGGTIRITADKTEKCLIISVEDSGAPFENKIENDNDSSGIGLTNTRKRLDVLYPNSYSLELLDSELGGKKVFIKLPLHQGESDV